MVQKHVILWCVSRLWLTFPQGYSVSYCQHSDKAIDDKNAKGKQPSFKATLSIFQIRDCSHAIMAMTLQTGGNSAAAHCTYKRQKKESVTQI